MKIYIAAALALIIATPLSASTYNFDYTYDGTNFVLDGGSSDPTGQALEVGDEFVVTLKAGAGKAWSILNDFTQIFDGAFRVGVAATRTGDMTATQFLHTDQVSQSTRLGLSQAQIHLGGQQIDYTGGSVFNKSVIEYTLNSSTDTTTILNNNVGYWGIFTQDSNVSYVDAPSKVSPVPLPASLPLAFAALGGLGLISRRRKRA